MKKSTFLRNAFVGLSLTASSLVAIAQDVHFSQFNQSPLTLNPALTGTTVWIRGILNYRTQWRAVTTNPYSTMGASFDVKSKRRWIKIKGETSKYRQSGESGFGWGFHLYNDKAGDGKMNTLQFNGSLAYQVYLTGKSMLAVGMQAGMMQRSINYNGLYWGTQYDPTSSTGYNTSLYPQGDKAISGNSFASPDISTGAIYTYKKSERNMRGNDQFDITVGAALFHVNRPKYDFMLEDKLAMRMVLHGNAVIGISGTNIAIAPGAMLMKQGPNQEVLLGGMIRYMLKEDSKYTGFNKGATISAGGYYRAKDAFVVTGLVEFASFGVGISYDVNVSTLTQASTGRGGFELVLRYLNPAPFIYSQASFGK